MSGVPTFPPHDPKNAPDVIEFPKEIAEKFENLMAHSVSTDTLKSSTGNQQTYRAEHEMAATIVLDERSSELAIVNPHRGGSGASTPDRDVPAGKKVLGTFHTHPYLSGAIGAIDGPDAKELLGHPDIFKIAQSGPKQFMFVKTSKSQVYKEGWLYSRDLPNELQKMGFPEFDESLHPTLTRTDLAARAVAKLCQLAYYKGAHGTLKREYPPVASAPK